jgi:hypothetical protein
MDTKDPELEQRLRRIEQVLAMKANANEFADEQSGANEDIPKPENLESEYHTTKWKVTWDPVEIPDVKRYELVIGADAAFSTVISEHVRTEPEFTYPGASAGITYFIRVRAVNMDSEEGPWSSTLDVSTGLVTTEDIEENALTQLWEFNQESDFTHLYSGGAGFSVGFTPPTPAIVTANELTSSFNNDDLTSYTTAVISPAADTTVLVSVTSVSTVLPLATPTLSGGGIASWTLVNTSPYDTGGAGHRSLWLFSGSSAAPGSAALVIDFGGGQTQLACNWSVFEFPNSDPTIDDGIVQSAHNEGNTAGLFTVTLGGFGASNNGTYGVFSTTSTNPIAHGAGFTEVHDEASEYQRLQGQHRGGAWIEVTATPGALTDIGGIAVEIQAGPDTPGDPGNDPQPSGTTDEYGPMVVTVSSASAIVLPFAIFDVYYQSIYQEGNTGNWSIMQTDDMATNYVRIRFYRAPSGTDIKTELMDMFLDYWSTLPFSTSWVNDGVRWRTDKQSTPWRGHDICLTRMSLPLLPDAPGVGTFDYTFTVDVLGSPKTFIYIFPKKVALRFMEYKNT